MNFLVASIRVSAPFRSKCPLGDMPLTIPPPPTAILDFTWAKMMAGLIAWYPPPAGFVPYMPTITGIPFSISSECLKNILPPDRLPAYTFSCSVNLTPLQLSIQTRGMFNCSAISWARKTFSLWPGIQAPARTLLSEAIMEAYLPDILPRPFITPVVPS